MEYGVPQWLSRVFASGRPAAIAVYCCPHHLDWAGPFCEGVAIATLNDEAIAAHGLAGVLVQDHGVSLDTSTFMRHHQDQLRSQ